MGFEDLVNKCNRFAVAKFGNATASITLSGVVVATIPGIFDEFAEVVSPYDSERLVVKPVFTVEAESMASISSDNVLAINGVDYSFDGKPKREGGLVAIYLAVKK